MPQVTCKDHYPPFAIVMTAACWVAVFAISLLKGGHGTKPILSAVKCDDAHPSGNWLYCPPLPGACARARRVSHRKAV